MTIKEKIAHIKHTRNQKKEDYYNLFGENFSSKLKEFDVELKLLDSQMQQIGTKKEQVETDKYNLLSEFAKENSKYKVGHRFNERFHITDIVWTDGIDIEVYDTLNGYYNIYEEEIEEFVKKMYDKMI